MQLLSLQSIYILEKKKRKKKKKAFGELSRVHVTHFPVARSMDAEASYAHLTLCRTDSNICATTIPRGKLWYMHSETNVSHCYIQHSGFVLAQIFHALDVALCGYLTPFCTRYRTRDQLLYDLVNPIFTILSVPFLSLPASCRKCFIRLME